jgi:hypothetical protein
MGPNQVVKTIWSGGEADMTLEELLAAMDEGIAQFNEE